MWCQITLLSGSPCFTWLYFKALQENILKEDLSYITEWLTLEKTSGGHLVQPPCSSKATLSKLPRAMSSKVLNNSKDGDSTTSLGNLCQCSVTLTEGQFPLPFRQHLLCFSLCPRPLVLSLDTTEKSLALSTVHYPFRHLYTLMWPSEPSLLQAE